ncbi:copia protein [Tanacetum coccineum]
MIMLTALTMLMLLAQMKLMMLVEKITIELLVDPDMPELEDYSIFEDDEDVGAEANMNNLETTIQVSPIPTTRIHKDHILDQVIGDLHSTTQQEYVQRIGGTAFLLCSTQQKIEAIRLFLAFASFKDFVVYHMDVKSAFLYGKIEEEVYVCQPPGFEDPNFPDRVYKVEKALYGLHQAPRAWLMIGSLMYLTSARPDIMFVVCACARYQVNLKVSHLHAVKRNFRLWLQISQTEAEYVALQVVLWTRLLDPEINDLIMGYNFMQNKDLIDNESTDKHS